MTEKILARASERAALEPGENVWVDVDVLMTHDVCGPGTIGIFKKEFGEDAKVYKTARGSSSSIGEESDQKYLFNITYNSRQMGIS